MNEFSNVGAVINGNEYTNDADSITKEMLHQCGLPQFTAEFQ